VGVIGLGTGTLATYALPGQTFTFYDIDPHVIDIAFTSDRFFTFIKDAKERGAKVDYILGDARLTLDKNDLQGDDRYGILAIDAFSSDAIPVHLITLEALQMYLEKIREDGIISFHVSNRYLNLKPVVARLAEKTGLVGYYMDDHSERYPGKTASTWCVLARKREYLDRLVLPDRWDKVKEETQFQLARLAALPDFGSGLGSLCLALGTAIEETKAPWKPLRTHKKVDVWTDDYSNLIRVWGFDADEDD
jgi:spermidine synthase